VLIIAVRKQDLSMVRLLLQHGANVNKAEVVFGKGNSDEDEDDHYLFEPLEDSGKLDTTPLSVALETKNVAIIELIRSKGAKGE
jgi:ankyrin repeat protein